MRTSTARCSGQFSDFCTCATHPSSSSGRSPAWGRAKRSEQCFQPQQGGTNNLSLLGTKLCELDAPPLPLLRRLPRTPEPSGCTAAEGASSRRQSEYRHLLRYNASVFTCLPPNI